MSSGKALLTLVLPLALLLLSARVGSEIVARQFKEQADRLGATQVLERGARVESELARYSQEIAGLAASLSCQSPPLGDIQAAAEYLNRLVLNEYAALYYVRLSQGRYFAPLESGEILLDSDYPGLTFLKRAANSRRPQTSTLFTSSISQEPVILLAAPVEAEGEVLGLVGAELPAARFSSLLADLSAANCGAMLLDKQGRVIANPGGSCPAGTSLLTGDRGGLEDLAGAIMGEPAGVLPYQDEDGAGYAYHRRLDSADNWVLLYTVPATAARRPGVPVQRGLWACHLAAAALLAGGAWLGRRSPKKRETKSKARPAEGAICFFEEGEGQDLGQASRTEEEVIKLILQLQDLADTLAGSGAQIDALLGSAHRLEQSLVLPGDAVRNKGGVG